jgi:glycosyltransferase involved in cell wall biosynthesis
MYSLVIRKFVYRIRKRLIVIFKNFIPQSAWSFLRNRTNLRFSTAKHRALFMNEWIAQKKIEKQLDKSSDFLHGVNVVGFIRSATGLGEAARSSVRALEEAEIAYSLVDLHYDVPDRQIIKTHPGDKFSEDFPYQINLLHINPNHLPYLWETYGKEKLLGRYTIGVWYWELSEIPVEWVQAFQVIDEMWAPTQFIRDALSPKSSIPVHFIPPCIDVSYDDRLMRADFGLPEDRFLFLCAYDVLSIQARKNPRGAIDTFRKAFSPEDQSVGLVIKINNAEENPEGVAELERFLADRPNCYFIKKVLEKDQFNALIHNIDCYVSLHRSEGFGLVAAESMFLGKPVIMTAWSGNVDFITADNCCPIGYKLVPVGPGNEPYDPNQLWADPDLEQAVQAMVSLKTNPSLYASISQNAQKTIRDKYSPKVIQKLVRERIQSIVTK